MFASNNDSISEMKSPASGGSDLLISGLFQLPKDPEFALDGDSQSLLSHPIPTCNMPKMTFHHQSQLVFLNHSLKAGRTNWLKKKKPCLFCHFYQRQGHCRQWRVRGKLNYKEIFDSVSLIVAYICWSSQKQGGRGDLCYATVNNAIIFLIPNYI